MGADLYMEQQRLAPAKLARLSLVIDQLIQDLEATLGSSGCSSCCQGCSVEREDAAKIIAEAKLKIQNVSRF